MKLDVNKIYVGELYISYELGDIINKTITPSGEEAEKEIVNLLNNGALDLSSLTTRRYIDWNTRTVYDGFLTVFKEQDNNTYMCYHNKQIYNLTGNNFCRNFTPIKKLLPKIDYLPPTELDDNEVINLFNILFNHHYLKFEKLYTKNLHSIKDFYVGTIFIPNGCAASNQLYEHTNLPETRLLQKNGGDLKKMFIDGNINKSVYKCLFLKLKDGLLNIQNNQMYDESLLHREIPTSDDPYKTNYDWIKELKEYLKQNKVRFIENEITLKKALKLFRGTN